MTLLAELESLEGEKLIFHFFSEEDTTGRLRITTEETIKSVEKSDFSGDIVVKFKTKKAKKFFSIPSNSTFEKLHNETMLRYVVRNNLEDTLLIFGRVIT
jgi:hypothetical protein